MRAFLACAAIITVAVLCPLHAANHPELRWKSVSTEHFIINYYDAVEPMVYPTWKIAEEVYKSVSDLYGYSGRQKINISLADYDDYSNGWAEWTAANIMILVPDLRFELRGNTTWLRNVINHELVHILSLEQKRKFQLFSVDASFTMQSPDESFTFEEPFPRITLYPSWLAEGMTQLETAEQGNDCWDSRRDMSLRCAVLDKKLLTLDEMGYFNHDMIGNEKVYSQGFNFSRYIESIVGSGTLRGLFDKGNEQRYTFNYLFTQHTGYSLEKLYASWRDSLEQHYKSMIPQNPTVDKVIVSNGIYTMMPELSQDGKYLAYFASGNDDGGQTELFVKDVATGDVVINVRYAHTALEFSPSSDKIYFIKSREQNRNGSLLNDIYCTDIKSKMTKRITWDARVYDIAVKPDGKSLVVIRYENDKFPIDILDLESDRFVRLIDDKPGEAFMNVCQNPLDSQALIVTKLVDGRSRLFSYDGHALKLIGPALGQEETPFVAADKRIYFSADYDGIFNIYSIDSTGADLKRHTNVTGGYFSPRVQSDGTMYVSKFGSKGFSIAKLTPEQITFTATDSGACTFKPLPVPQGKVTIKAHPYEGAWLRSIAGFQLSGIYSKNRSFLSGQYDPDIDTASLIIMAGFQVEKSDALHKRSLGFGLNLGTISDLSESAGDSRSNLKGVIPQFSFQKNSEKNVSKCSEINTVLQPDNIRNHFNASLYQNASSTNGNSSDSSSKSPVSTIPIAMPMIGFGGQIGELNITGLSQVVMAMIVIPVQLNATFQLSYQITPRLSFAMIPNLSYSIFDVALDFTMPITLNWSNLRTYNKDVSYNMADYYSFTGFVIPLVVPYKIERNLPDGTIEKSIDHYRGHNSGIDALVSLPILKYCALQINLNESLVHFQQRIRYDFDVSEISLNYDLLSSKNSVNLVFPLLRNVNKQFIYYWDALYGSVGYSYELLANTYMFKDKYYDSKIFSEKSYLGGSFLEHKLNAILTFGHTKEYTFDKKLAVDFSYEFLRGRSSFSVLLGF